MRRFNKHVIVVGSARSGTSWLAELLARPYRYRLLFEPEHEFQTEKGHLLVDRWIRTPEEAGEGHRYLKKVFQNRIDNDWIAQHSNRKWKRHLWPWIPKRFVIKFVRCNLAAGYMNKAFGIPVIHVVRDPFEVIASQQRVAFPWLFDLGYFIEQKDFVSFVQNNYGFDLNIWASLSNIEILSLRWCLENVVVKALQAPNSSNYYWVDYKDLKNNVNVFTQLCERIQFDSISNIEEWYTRPSSKTHPKSSIYEGGESKRLSEQEIAQISAILKLFEYTC